MASRFNGIGKIGQAPVKSSPLAVSSGGSSWAEKQAAKKAAQPSIAEKPTLVKANPEAVKPLFKLQPEDWEILWGEVSKMLPLPTPPEVSHPSYPVSISFSSALEEGDVFHLAGLSAMIEKHYPGVITPPHALPIGAVGTPLEFTLRRLLAVGDWVRLSLLDKDAAPHPWSLQGEENRTNFFAQDGAFQEELESCSSGEGFQRGRRRQKKAGGTTITLPPASSVDPAHHPGSPSSPPPPPPFQTWAVTHQ